MLLCAAVAAEQDFDVQSFVLAKTTVYGQFQNKMALVHFEALHPSETLLYVWKLSRDIPK